MIIKAWGSLEIIIIFIQFQNRKNMLTIETLQQGVIYVQS